MTSGDLLADVLCVATVTAASAIWLWALRELPQ